MRDYLKKKIHPYDAFLKCQVHMVELGQAYVERLVLKDFITFMEKADKELIPILNRVCNLYALRIIEENKGWYLETGYLEGIKTKAIRRMINKLCQEIRPDTKGLVQAWGIPDALLGAQIATL
jgi:acyl-CoA oxidase